MEETLMLKTLKIVKDRLKDTKTDTEKFNSNLNYLLSAKNSEEFLEKYKNQLNYNNIKIDALDFSKQQLIFSLNELKCLAIESVIEYYEEILEEAS